MAAANPFAASAAGITEAEAEARPLLAIVAAAEAMWDVLGALPGKAEATLAQRRLEEAVFWASRAEQA
ncbi:hypothetical protein [Zavarzinia aquatilis]|uniref:Acb2/Tad1 hairpin domain-containing protein n=1 Tax=Zavarzinia aquatilis TaxID=2211142 RepID=A0A317DSN1_9PROT|nr:hypothetical protein [Zavarzinia aquatilis]PWR17679.1 hypothetical protein DKG74_20540 [Zavarzinia aquatilis]